jgi:hypothetical protein
MGWVTEITNVPTGRRYCVSTIEARFVGGPVWQTAVFRKRFGPFAAWFKPALIYDGVEASLARLQHEQVEALVQKTPPSDWESVKRKWLTELIYSGAEAVPLKTKRFLMNYYD